MQSATLPSSFNYNTHTQHVNQHQQPAAAATDGNDAQWRHSLRTHSSQLMTMMWVESQDKKPSIIECISRSQPSTHSLVRCYSTERWNTQTPRNPQLINSEKSVHVYLPSCKHQCGDRYHLRLFADRDTRVWTAFIESVVTPAMVVSETDDPVIVSLTSKLTRLKLCRSKWRNRPM